MTARTIAVGADVCDGMSLQPFRCSACHRPLVSTSDEALIGISDNGVWVTAPRWMTCECGREMLRPIPPGATDAWRRPIFPDSSRIGLVGITEWGTAILNVPPDSAYNAERRF